MCAGRYILILVLFCAASCTREVVTVREAETEKVPVSFRVALPSGAVTRAGWEWDGYFPEITPDEKLVKNLLIVAFKNNLLEEHTWYGESDFLQETDGSILIEPDGSEDDGILSLDPGPHYFYALCNTPPDLFAVLEPVLQNGAMSLTKGAFEKQVVENITVEYLTEQQGQQLFFMTNSEPPELETVYSEDQILANPILTNDITIRVGHAISKVSRAYVAPEVETGELHGTLSDIKYIITNNPAAMYLMPVVEDDIVKTPHYSSPFDASYFQPQLSDLDMSDTGLSWMEATTSALAAAGNMEWGYCMENNNAEQLQGNSPILLIKGKFSPATWLNSDGTQGTPTTDETFWRIMLQNNDLQDLSYEPGYYNEVPLPEIINKYVPCRIEKYAGGVCYYTYWLNDGGDYMVRRNTFNKVAITHLHGAGSPDPDIDPGESYKAEATSGRMAIGVVTWDEYQREETLGQ